MSDETTQKVDEMSPELLRLSDNLTAEVKKIVEPAHKVAGDALAKAEAVQRCIDEEVSTKLSGIQKMTEDLAAMHKEDQKKAAKFRLSGRALDIEVETPDEEATEVLRTFMPDGTDVVGPYTKFQRAWDEFHLLKGLRAANRGKPEFNHEGATKAVVNSAQRLINAADAAGLRSGVAMDTAEAAAGAEWLQTGMSAELYGRFELEPSVANAIPSFTVPMGVHDYKWPVASSGSTAYLVSEATTSRGSDTVTASTVGTYNPTWAMEVIGAYVAMSRELTEDSIVPAVPSVFQDMLMTLNIAREDWFMNGDSTTGGMDADLTTTTDPRMAGKGIRRWSYDYSASTWYDNGGAAFSKSTITAALALGGKWFANSREALFIAPTYAYWKMLALDDVFTVDKYGPGQATVVTGELARYLNIPIVITDVVPKLNATGVVDTTAANNTKTALYAINRRALMRGVKRGILLETDVDIYRRTVNLVATFREDIQPMLDWTTSGNEFFITIYDITA